MPLSLFADFTATENRLLIVLVQLCAIVGAARAFAILFKRLGQPAVMGEVVAGIALGASGLGKLLPPLCQQFGWPNIHAYVFNPEVGLIFATLSQLGLVLLLFLIGLEFDFEHLRFRGRAAAGISVAGIAAPFALGWLLAWILYPHLDSPVDERGFALFLGTALSITAIPMLGRILVELNVQRTALGTIAIAAAAVGDAVGWIILASVSAVVRAEFDARQTGLMIAETVGFALGMFFIARPLLARWSAWVLPDSRSELSTNAMAGVLLMVFFAGIATSKIGIFAVFGAFILGACMSDQPRFRAAIAVQLRDFVTVFFLPIFFTYTGLHTDIGTLGTPLLWLFAGIVSAVAIVGKWGGCALAARLGGFEWREAHCIGVMMNARGLMELIVINVGAELGVVPQSVYCMLVLMALLTTAMTAPILKWLIPGTSMEEDFRKSDLAR